MNDKLKSVAEKSNITPAPEWTKDLVICEIAPKGYTSPHGPESGTFNSLQEKIPHLQSTGVNGVWLTGHSLSDPKQFYNVWTQYACIDQFKLDPSLGTPQEFKALVDAFHNAGIRIFLDVITHGVMHGSPIAKEHPDWMKGESWGMTDFNWGDKIPALDKWWVDGWTETVLRYGIDGFRLDLGHARTDLWNEIRRRCAADGHPITVFSEHEQVEPGIYDFSQHYLRTTVDHANYVLSQPLCSDLPAAIHACYGQKTLKPGYLGNVQLSCHDNGWEGYPADLNPYVARGSRYLFGYTCLFAPGVPVFMAGEEWDCEYRPLPILAPNCFGGAAPGKGRWLYGGWTDWSKYNEPARQAMLKDVTRMISIRKEYADVLAAEDLSSSPNIASVPFEGDHTLPKPYIRWNDKRAILITANPGEQSVSIRLKLAMEILGWKCRTIKVTDLWAGKSVSSISISAETNEIVIPAEIGADKTPGGGIKVILLSPAG